MDDKRTPMEAEVQELPVMREANCPEDYYGTAAKPKTRKSYIGFWIWMCLAVIAVCTVCVVAAVKHVRVENGENGWRLAVQSTESTDFTEDPVQNLDLPEEVSKLLPEENISDEISLPVTASGEEHRSPDEIYASVSSAVVCVEVDSYYSSETYTGVVISSDGCILSATEGLSGAFSITVSFPDGSIYSARRLGEDSISGVCLLKVEAEDLHTVLFSGDAAGKVGQSVYSVSNPYGTQIPNVFTDGMISASRSVEIGGSTYHLFQSSALRDHTEYGCPVLDDSGLVLGITTPIGRRIVSGEDPCFALCREDLSRILSSFERSASESSVWLGFEVADIPQNFLDFMQYPGSVWIEALSADIASNGKLFEGDVITAVDQYEVTSAADFERILSGYQAGDRVLLTVYRNKRFSYYIVPVKAR